MALPAGVTKLGEFKGAKGETGTIASVSMETVPADQPGRAELSGPSSDRHAKFYVPRGLPGAESVPTDEAVAAALAAPESDARVALGNAIGAYSAPRSGTRWVPVGDSLTSVDGGGAPRAGWTVQAAARSNGDLRVLQNAGIFGNNAADVRARLDSDVLAFDPNLVTIWVGTNDISQDRPLGDYQTDVTDIVRRVRAGGARPVLLTIPPRQDTSKRTKILEWNAWLRWFARFHAVDIVDAYAVLVDPATGLFAAGFAHPDGLHISQAGHYAVANAFTAALLPKLPAGAPMKPMLTNDPTNLLGNGLLLLGDSPSPTSWVPSYGAGWAASLVQHAEFAGRAFRLAGTTPAGHAELTQAAAGDAWSPGDRLLFTAKVRVDASAGVPEGAGLSLNCNFFGSSGVNAAIIGLRTPGFSGRIAHEIVVPDGTTLVQLALICNPTSAGTATYLLGEGAIFNLTRLGAA